jgi:Fur family transcriptional regulator, iron response regulator
MYKGAMAKPRPAPAEHALEALLRDAGLKPTRQRLALGRILFTGAHRHVTPETLFNEAQESGADVSLATVYNALHQFRDAGLVREVKVDSERRWFDTNAGAHHHFFIEETGALIDIHEEHVDVSTPAPPRGYTVSGVDVVVRLKARK